ncbi:MAG: histidine--tRNA ligase [Acidimicrobiia bacterium]|nr:histidine--tRNA ligase [Acidimicrobiia bacterium]MYC45080.1 histidine--tRNA ligase [Acidimicrobiia bacterium]MYI18650.1 histidine--tRNA ligase [Acidimicrobiia bacterium]
MSLQAPRGTRDILAPESARLRALVDAFATAAELGGYGQVHSPMFEQIEVFQRVGEATDIVSKEMYQFRDPGDRHLALRPELTASLARAFVQHRPALPWKAWYEGPQFRYEKPQAGRFRQFNQVGAELFGSDDPQADVDVIALAWRFCTGLGLGQLRLVVNSLGDRADREAYLAALAAYFEERAGELSAQGRETLSRNPLRLLDSKRPADRAVTSGAPDIEDYWSPAAAEHFAAVLAGLEALGIPFERNPRLVRGLDYYRRTAFELASDALDGAQDAVGGGGRYDGLVADLGGPDVPGVGFALGVDRLLLACDAEGTFPAPPGAAEVFVVDVTGGRQASLLAEELRRAGIRVERAFDGRSMKAQMKAADRSGARWALLVGADELAGGVVSLRRMRGHEAAEAPESVQSRIPRGGVVEELARLLAEGAAEGSGS